MAIINIETISEDWFYNVFVIGIANIQSMTQMKVKAYLISHEIKYEIESNFMEHTIELKQVESFELANRNEIENSQFLIPKEESKKPVRVCKVDSNDLMSKYDVPNSFPRDEEGYDFGLFGIIDSGIFGKDSDFDIVSYNEFSKILNEA